jgi:hypothetical protein
MFRLEILFFINAVSDSRGQSGGRGMHPLCVEPSERGRQQQIPLDGIDMADAVLAMPLRI